MILQPCKPECKKMKHNEEKHSWTTTAETRCPLRGHRESSVIVTHQQKKLVMS